MSFDDVAFAAVEENDPRIQFWLMTKSKGKDLMKITDLSDKSGQL